VAAIYVQYDDDSDREWFRTAPGTITPKQRDKIKELRLKAGFVRQVRNVNDMSSSDAVAMIRELSARKPKSTEIAIRRPSVPVSSSLDSSPDGILKAAMSLPVADQVMVFKALRASILGE
jgi:hypothetical protein